MDGLFIFSFIGLVVGLYVIHFYWTLTADHQFDGVSGNRAERDALLNERERTLDLLVALEEQRQQGIISRRFYLVQRAELRQQAANLSRRISQMVLMSQESLRLMIDTDGEYIYPSTR